MDGGILEVKPLEQEQAGKLAIREDSGALPGGTVTFLFTDIEGSTRLLEQLHEQYARLLSEQREILRAAIKSWRGHEIETQGDSFFVAFPRATDAIGCVMEAQRRIAGHAWPQGVSVRVRMGLHTGEPLVAKTGYIGMDVHRAARVAAAGHGGQVLLSQATRELVYQDLPPDALLRFLGEHKLKDIRFAQPIYQLDIDGLPCEFPPLKTLSVAEEPPTPGEAPFKGLQYFDEADARLFFGRSQVTARLVEAVSQQRFLAVVGASGSGKSSVVRAGLVPVIKARKGPHWQVKVITPSFHPLEALAICLTSGSESVTATATLMDDMQNNLRSLHLYCQRTLVSDKDPRLLLVVDQFEELFTLCRSESERLAFVTNLLYAACIQDGKVTVLITLRADFYDRLAQYVGLRELVAAHQVYIGAMNASELRQAIEEPARLGGWEFTPGLVELMLHEIGAEGDRQPEPGALPLLSHALLETWNHRRGNLMSLKAYAESGGVRGAIARTAESVFYGELTPDQQVIAKDIFLRLTELGEGTQDTRRRISIHELIPPGPAVETEQVRAVLGKLADARLIITGEGTVEVAHEALIREWPTLREWLAADREGLRLHRHLTEAAQDWALLERDAGALYRGARLSQALEWAMANPRSLSAMEQDFLEASRGAAEREQAEREAQRQRELEAAQKLAEERGRSAKRLRRRAWLLGGVLVLALVLAVVAGIFGQRADTNAKLANQNYATAEAERQRAEGETQQRATAESVAVQERQSAQEQERLATSRYLTAAALDNLALDSQLSAHLAIRAYQAYPTTDAENALHTVLPELHLLKSTDIYGNLNRGVWTFRDGQLIIWGNYSLGIGVRDYAAGTLSWFSQGPQCGNVKPTPDGRWLVAQCPMNASPNMQVWDVEAQRLHFTSPDLGIEFNRSGLIPPSAIHSLLTYGGYDDMTVHVWEVSSGKELFVFGGHTLNPENWIDLAASPDGKRAATYGSDGLVILWNMETGQKILQFHAHEGGIGGAAFSPNGAHLATWGTEDVTIKSWDLTSLSPEPRLEYLISHQVRDSSQSGGNKIYINLLYSPDGTRLAAGGADGLVRLWDAQTGKLQLALPGHEANSIILSFSQDGKRLYSLATDMAIKEWDVTPGRELLALPGQIGSVPYSPDGTKLALSSPDGTLSIVDSRSGEVLRQWQAHPDEIEDIAWSPDGTRLATTDGQAWWGVAGKEFAVKIWDPAIGQLLKEIPSDKYQGFPEIAWSPDGSRLAAGSYQTGEVFIWDTGSWNLLLTLPKLAAIWDLAFTPDGNEITTSASELTDQTYTYIKMWDVVTGKQVFQIRLWPDPAYDFAFSSDEKRLAYTQATGDIFLGFTEFTSEYFGTTFTGGTNPVYAVAYSPDGALLAAGDTAGKVRVWDVKTQKLRLELATFSDKVFRLAFSPDGRRLVASSQNRTTYVYILPADELIQQVRSRILRPMKPKECQEYLQKNTCPLGP